MAANIQKIYCISNSYLTEIVIEKKQQSMQIIKGHL